jgi:hypothetical protein
MKKMISLCLFFTACATTPQVTPVYTIRMQDKPTSHQGKFEILETKEKTFTVKATAQGIRPQILDFWVEITNKSKKAMTVDGSFVALKKLDSSALITAVDPEPGLKHLEEAIHMNGDAKAAAEKENIIKTFLRKITIQPGKSAAGIVQFLVPDTEGKWQLQYNWNGSVIKGPTFVSKNVAGK